MDEVLFVFLIKSIIYHFDMRGVLQGSNLKGQSSKYQLRISLKF